MALFFGHSHFKCGNMLHVKCSTEQRSLFAKPNDKICNKNLAVSKIVVTFAL